MAAAATLGLAGCSAPHEPQVTFYAHGDSVRLDPAQYCDATGQDCAEPPEDPVGELRVPPGEPVQISVPAEVSDTPWQVVFLYRTAEGEQLDSRSAVFAPGDRHAYTLHLPPDAEQLDHVEVQQFGAVLTPGVEGGVDFGISGSWLLDVRR
nr:DUF2771 family protein [Saccharopolyspora sp. HNM0983]